jgi:pyrroloquinoline quinone biosynthesis protein B
MQIRVLGSAAGGGFPQWNCGCDNCRAVRSGASDTQARSQESLAISADGRDWFLLNVSPEVRAQLESQPCLHPRARRDSPVVGVVLTNGDLDHCLGLFSLRESHPLRLYTTASIERGLREGNVMYRTLQRFPEQLRFSELELGTDQALLRADGEASGLSVQAVALPGKLPLHLEGLHAHAPGDNIGLLVRSTSSAQVLAYFPGVAGPTPQLRAALALASCVFFDGTFWSSDELPSQGLGGKRAADMAHWPIGGEAGSARFLSEFAAARRVFIHINNTNPMLRASSSEALQLKAAGIEIAYDGMQVEL